MSEENIPVVENPEEVVPVETPVEATEATPEVGETTGTE